MHTHHIIQPSPDTRSPDTRQTSTETVDSRQTGTDSRQADKYMAARKEVHRHAHSSSRGRLTGIQLPSPPPLLLTHSHNLATFTSPPHTLSRRKQVAAPDSPPVFTAHLHRRYRRDPKARPRPPRSAPRPRAIVRSRRLVAIISITVRCT